MMMAVVALHPLFQFVMEREHRRASRALEHGGKQPVQNRRNARANQTGTEQGGKTQMLEIAFMNRIEMLLAFIEHANIISR